MWIVNPFETKYLDQLDRLPPENWQSNAYDLFMHNDWQPWFHSFQVVEKTKLLGFGMLFHFEDVSWLGWLLVDKKYRNLGVGTQIMNHMITYSHKLGAKKIILTATELGISLYEKLGFKTTGHYLFLSLPKYFKANFTAPLIRKARPSDFESICQLDFEATAEKRDQLIANHMDATYVFATPGIEGFYIEDLGNGLVIANNFDAGKEMADFRIRKRDKTVIIPEGNKQFLSYLLDKGFTIKSKIPRMVLGAETSWNQEMIFNRAAGYCG